MNGDEPPLALSRARGQVQAFRQARPAARLAGPGARVPPLALSGVNPQLLDPLRRRLRGRIGEFLQGLGIGLDVQGAACRWRAMLAVACRLRRSRPMLDDPLQPWLQRQLDVTLRRRTPVSGGCIHSAWRLELADGGLLFAKTSAAADLPLLEAEADGLAALSLAAEGSGLLLPRPRLLGSCGDQAVLLLDWLELGGKAASAGWRQLGLGLARLHRRSLAVACTDGDRLDGAFGWPRDNVIGSTPQVNGWLPDWASFFRRRRLEPQLQLLERRGVRLRGSQPLLERLQDWLAAHRPEPVLVHGDLWSGNAALTSGGSGALFDPAVHRADREVDLAMAQLFGGFPASFFEGYEQEWPLPPGHRARVRLYNLYHLLNHANLFGGGYIAQSQACLEALLAAPPGG